MSLSNVLPLKGVPGRAIPSLVPSSSAEAAGEEVVSYEEAAEEEDGEEDEEAALLLSSLLLSSLPLLVLAADDDTGDDDEAAPPLLVVMVLLLLLSRCPARAGAAAAGSPRSAGETSAMAICSCASGGSPPAMASLAGSRDGVGWLLEHRRRLARSSLSVFGWARDVIRRLCVNGSGRRIQVVGTWPTPRSQAKEAGERGKWIGRDPDQNVPRVCDLGTSDEDRVGGSTGASLSVKWICHESESAGDSY
jgi:hypothetical protein